MKSSQKLSILLALLLILVTIYIFVYFAVVKPLDRSISIFGGPAIINLEKISQGYTLIAPYNRVVNEKEHDGKIYLLDIQGNAIHTWKTENQPLYSILKKEGNLITVLESPKYKEFYPPGGNTGTIQELDWDSNVVWEYKEEGLHHDVTILPSGNILAAVWEKTPSNVAELISGGVDNTQINNTTWSDKIIEINREGKVVWSWHSHENLDPEIDTLGALMPKFGWTYVNGMDYTEKNPIDGSEAIILSMRSLNTVMIIRKEDGKVIWRSPKNMLNTQHDPSFLPNGNILVFDNGLTRQPSPFPVYASRVVEIDPRTNKVVWQFEAGQNVIDKVKLFSPIVGGAQRLMNGNTLITDGVRGHIFEVTPDGKIVWDIINPYTTKQTGAFPNNFIFNAKRYGTEIKWPEKIRPTFNKTHYAIYKLLKSLYP